MTKIFLPLQTVLDAKAANGIVTTKFIEDFKIAEIQLAMTGSSPTAVVKFQISNSDVAPDFSAAQSASNHWTYAESVDLDSGDPVNGATGYTASGTAVYKTVELNINGARWFNAIVSGYAGANAAASAVTAKLKLYNNA